MSSDGNLSVAFNERASAVNETRMKIPWVALLIASATVWGSCTWDKDFSSLGDVFYDGGLREREGGRETEREEEGGRERGGRERGGGGGGGGGERERERERERLINVCLCGCC